ncbi:coproporphyrinogen III oxidase [Sporosarcina ureae]|uniref:coproporphyrinogen III oxidase n=1 Tax=Sporosarcina TaxID=1569 RepID=UPI000A15E849|nr:MULTISPECIES: coproporphyrinogen III oxidase [Sporosarcina]ARJ38391.1 coproporphyrinogen III oxidase [Sporosarcina ureae]PIC82212.1 coproporphyrinogen III oxidase [Sporosarcina sp. P1]
MQQLYVNQQFPQDWIRMFTHLANLFFEQSKIVTDRTDETAIALQFREEYEESPSVTVDIQWQDKHYTSRFAEEVKETEEREQIRQRKRMYSHVLLDALEQATGMDQEWGILTGIRPTKLYHMYIQDGHSVDEAKQLLQQRHRVSVRKSDLIAKIADVQLNALPDLYSLKEEVSIYIGIPFCPTKCAYCTFPAYAIHRKSGRVETFLDGLHEEMRAMGKWLKEHDIRITTIYFGGGTPTSIEADEMDALYQTMTDSFPYMEHVREVTVEAGRPDTITVPKLEVLKKWGIDRISVNPQSYTDETLKAIGRHHTVQETIDKYWLSREQGMRNINMDLIIGLPNEGLEEFEHSLAETEKMQPESLTIHTLSFKRASEMTRNKDKYQVADRETVGKMMTRGEEWSRDNGYIPYYLYRQKNILGNLENVGYSKPGEESLYNILIMEEAQTIIGLGCGASSKFMEPATGKLTQFHNPKEPGAYILGFEEAIDKKIAYLEKLFPSSETIK